MNLNTGNESIQKQFHELQILLNYYSDCKTGSEIILNSRGEIIHLNSAAEDLLGIDRYDAAKHKAVPADFFTGESQKIMARICSPKSEKQIQSFNNIEIESHTGNKQTVDIKKELLGSFSAPNAIRINLTSSTGYNTLLDEGSFTDVLLTSLPIPVFYKDKQGRYIGCNPAFEKFTGVSKKEIAGKTVYDLWQTEQAKRYHIKDLELIQNPENQSYEFEVKHADGSMRDVIFNKSVFYSGKGEPEGIIGTYIDISDLKHIQNELLKTRSELRDKSQTLNFLFDNTIQGIVYQDKGGKITFINKAAKRILGIDNISLIEQKPLDIQWDIIREDGSEFPAEAYPLAISLKTGKTVRNTIMGIYNNKNDNYSWINTNSYPILDESGDVEQVIVTFEDITKLKKSQAELIAAKRKADESNELKSAFLNNLSHEIRTPMNSIMGFAAMLGKPNISDSQRTQFSQVISQNTSKLLSVIEDILIISSLEKKQEESLEEEVNVNTLTEELYSAFQEPARQKKLEFTRQKACPDTDIIINIDKTKLRQILKKLLDNAVKYTEKGKVEFGYKTQKDESGADKIIFYIKDTGIGIEPAIQKKIFEQFRQGDFSSKKRYGGTGLGLTIATAFSDIINAKLNFRSMAGKGSNFMLEIPVNLNPDDAEDSKKYTVLIAEDEEINYLYLKALVSDLKMNTLRALTGEEAIKLCKEKPEIDLVLMDIRMPEMNGDEAAKIIKNLRSELPIIAQTAYAKPETNPDKEYPVFDGFIRKPVDELELYELMSQYVF